MTIGLIGNINNINFVLLRYFFDLGISAKLFPYFDDGKGDSAHFHPSHDTDDLNRWSPFIETLPVRNHAAEALPGPVAKIWTGAGQAPPPRRSWGRQRKEVLTKMLGACERLMGTGIAPAVLTTIGRRLDIFYPYSLGVEFLEAPWFQASMPGNHPLRVLAMRWVRRLQARGIQQARHVINPMLGETQIALQKHGVKATLPWAVPMVYADAHRRMHRNKEELIQSLRLPSHDFLVVSHARHLWRESREANRDDIFKTSKNNHRLILAFAKFLQVTRHRHPLLVMCKYGPNWPDSFRLVNDLGIAEHVAWLPVQPRKVIMSLLPLADLAAGEFYDHPALLWGGTGWEILASGVPLLQAFEFFPGQFSKVYGLPEPPILAARTEDDIFDQLQCMENQPEKKLQLGRQGQEWFHAHHGLGLARKWASLIVR